MNVPGALSFRKMHPATIRQPLIATTGMRLTRRPLAGSCAHNRVVTAGLNICMAAEFLTVHFIKFKTEGLLLFNRYCQGL